jgi:hypothetical protein
VGHTPQIPEGSALRSPNRRHGDHGGLPSVSPLGNAVNLGGLATVS